VVFDDVERAVRDVYWAKEQGMGGIVMPLRVHPLPAATPGTIPALRPCGDRCPGNIRNRSERNSPGEAMDLECEDGTDRTRRPRFRGACPRIGRQTGAFDKTRIAGSVRRSNHGDKMGT
jgi:hypothetical protein